MADPLETAGTCQISRLGAAHAPAIVDCFRRVYGLSYANGLFYDAIALAAELASGRIGSVGALTGDGTVLGHMAMTVHPEAMFVELGSTVVVPEMRGGGVAWKIGAELSAWCRELGYRGFLHYPTTDHHIMQQRSVARGFETGLMLGYIPATTDAGVRTGAARGRQAATIVYEPYEAGPAARCYLPARFEGLIRSLATPTGLERTWAPSRTVPSGPSVLTTHRFPRRGLNRLEVVRTGDDLGEHLAVSAAAAAPCLQLDFHLTDAAVAAGVESAWRLGFRFCGWLPGYRRSDVLRLQRVDEAVTDLTPLLVNPTAASLLELYRQETA